MADPNRALFESVVRLLTPVLNELVFVGGCTTGLFITDPAASGIRPTKDVDAIVDVTSYSKYAALADRLRAIGLVEDATEDAPLCRWRYGAAAAGRSSRATISKTIAVVDGRPEIVTDVAAASSGVREYIAGEIQALLDNPDFIEALPGFLLPDAGSQSRRSLLEERLRALSR